MTQPIEPVDRDEAPGARTPQPAPAAGAVYGLGLIGALVWYWRRADGVGGHALAVLKAIVWPAILVYEALGVLKRLSGSGADGTGNGNGNGNGG